MTTYTTASGSTYKVDRDLKLVRRVVRSKISDSERVSTAWRVYEALEYLGVGTSLAIYWGTGRDECSPNDAWEGPRQRWTVTTPVITEVSA